MYKVNKVGHMVMIDSDTWERMKRRLRRLNVDITETPYRERKRSAKRKKVK